MFGSPDATPAHPISTLPPSIHLHARRLCHRWDPPGTETVDRLRQIREFFFSTGNSLGRRTIPLNRQSQQPQYAIFPENAYWQHEDVLFATLHVVGSNNNVGRSPEANAEAPQRSAANLAWLAQTFRRAKRENSKAVVLLMHANPKFEDLLPPRRGGKAKRKRKKKRRATRPSGYSGLLAALELEMLDYDKPVLLMHGDTHYFRIDRPMARRGLPGRGAKPAIMNFTRAETFGFPNAHWLRVTVDPSSRDVFRITPEIVEENVIRLASSVSKQR